MTEKKMTESEIMKALEICCNSTCSECEFGKQCNGYTTVRLALDLINRKNAEIERLTVNMNAFGLGMKRESERAETARAEAIKEFVERAIEQKHECGCNFRKKPVYAVTADKIAQIAKEMGVEL